MIAWVYASTSTCGVQRSDSSHSRTPTRDTACGPAARAGGGAHRGRATRGARALRLRWRGTPVHSSEIAARSPRAPAGRQSFAVTQLHVAAHGLQAQVPGAIPARALQRVTRQVAVLARRRVEAVGNVAAEGRDLVGVARVRTGAHVEIAAHRGGVEVRAA